MDEVELTELLAEQLECAPHVGDLVRTHPLPPPLDARGVRLAVRVGEEIFHVIVHRVD